METLKKLDMISDLILQVLPYLLVLLIVLGFLSYIINDYKKFGLIHSRWHQYFDNFQLSAVDFYKQVAENAKAKQIPNISIKYYKYPEGGVFSGERAYLQIHRGDYAFLICAAPFGTGYFVSWWLGERVPFSIDLAMRLPWIGKSFQKALKMKTFYKMDTELMFQESVRRCVSEAIDTMTNPQGIRPLSEIENLPQQISE